MRRHKYHGLIYSNREPGMKDHYSIQWYDKDGKSYRKDVGYGETGVAAAIQFFEQDMSLEQIGLRVTPLGWRVFTTVGSPETHEECLGSLRRNLRSLLGEFGIGSNPDWTEANIVDAFRRLLENRR